METININKSISSRFEKITIIIQFFLIYLIIIIGFRTYLQSKISEKKEILITKLKNFVEKLSIATNPEFFIKKIIRKIDLLHKYKKTLFIEKIINHLKGHYDINLHVYIYNENKNLHKVYPPNSPNIWLMRQLMHVLTTQDKETYVKFETNLDKKISSAFGFGKKLSIIRSDKRKFINVFPSASNPDIKGFLYWNYTNNNQGIIIFCPNLPNNYKMFYKVINQKNNSNINFQFYFGIGKKHSKKWYNHKLQLDHTSLNAYLRSIKNNNSFYESRDYIYYFLETSNDTIYFSRLPITNSLIEKIYLSTPLLSIVILYFALVSFYYSNFIWQINLKQLLALSFILASSIPVLALLFYTSDMINSYSKNLYIKLQNSIEDQIKNFVYEFYNFLQTKTSALNSILAKYEILNENNWKKLPKILNKHNINGVIQLRNSSGKLLYASDYSNLLHRDELLVALSRRAIERYASNRLNEYIYKPDPYFHTLVRRDDMGFSTILNFPNKFQIVLMNEKKLAYYFTTIRNKNCPVAFLDVVVPLENLIVEFFRTQKNKSIVFDNQKIRLFIFNISSFKWLFNLPNPKIQKPLLNNALLSILQKKTINNKQSYKNSNIIITSISPLEFENFSIVAIITDKILIEKLEKIKTKSLLAIILFFIFILLISNTITKLFIDPIRYFEKGLEALSQRNFEYNIPISSTSDNEFSQLAKAYNQVVSEAKEILSAKQVQRGFLPQYFPSPQNYSIYGTVIPCSDLGGDYLDCIELSNNRILFVICDVAGHGIGSALITAFCKTFIFHLSQKENLSPFTIAITLDKALKLYYKTKLFLGLVCGILDLNSNEAEIVIAGHIYPIFVSYHKKTVNFVGSPSYPLGITSKPINPKIINLHFDKETALLVYTDGLVEAIKSHSNYTNYNTIEQVGFENIMKWAISAYSTDAQLYINNILKLYENWNDNNYHKYDDITLFTIIRI